MTKLELFKSSIGQLTNELSENAINIIQKWADDSHNKKQEFQDILNLFKKIWGPKTHWGAFSTSDEIKAVIIGYWAGFECNQVSGSDLVSYRDKFKSNLHKDAVVQEWISNKSNINPTFLGLH